MWKSCQERRQLEISEKKKATQLGRLAEVVKLFPFVWQLYQEAINYTGSNVSNVVSKRTSASSIKFSVITVSKLNLVTRRPCELLLFPKTR